MSGRKVSAARWERGDRCHGLWIGLQRIGHVGLSPRGIRPLGYTWSADADLDVTFGQWLKRSALKTS